MAVVQKTFAFATDLEGLVDQDGAGTSAVLAHEPADGNPSGSAKYTQGTKNTTVTDTAMQAAASQTWETWGVPAGATVNSVRVVSASRKVAAVSKLNSHSWTVNVYNDAGTALTANLLSEALPTAVGGWLAAGGLAAAQSVSQASSTNVRFGFAYTVSTSSGGGSASVDARFDEIVLEIDYTEASPPISHSESWTLSFASAMVRRITRSLTGSLSFSGDLQTQKQLAETPALIAIHIHTE